MTTTLYCPVRFDRVAVTWRTAPGRGRRVIGTLSRVDDGYTFRYDGQDLSAARSEGFQGYPGMPDLQANYNEQAMASFASRLPSRDRVDFGTLVRAWGASPEMTDFELLGSTGGRLPTDMFEFIPWIDLEEGTEFFTDLSRVPDYEGSVPLAAISAGTELSLVPEPTNAWEPEAVKVRLGTDRIGYLKAVHGVRIAEAIGRGMKVKAFFERARTNGYRPEAIVRVRIG